MSILPTAVFFYGQEPGQEVAIEIEPGKTLIVKFLTVGDPHPDGRRTVFFELNGQPRSVTVRDLSLEPEEKVRAKADPANPMHVGAPMPGLVVTVAVKVGDTVTQGQKLLSLEAMKMETTLYAERRRQSRGAAGQAGHASRHQRFAVAIGVACSLHGRVPRRCRKGSAGHASSDTPLASHRLSQVARRISRRSIVLA